MTILPIYLPKDWTSEEAQSFTETLQAQAAALGCYNERGPKAGQGNLREMFQYIASGEILVHFHQYDFTDDMLTDAAQLRVMATEQYPTTLSDALNSLAAALEAAAKLKADVEPDAED